MYDWQKIEFAKVLSKLKKDVTTRTSFFVEDNNYPSLYLWAKYQEYLNAVLCIFEANTKKEYEELSEIVTKLELDEFFIDAKSSLAENQTKIINYVERVEKFLKGDNY